MEEFYDGSIGSQLLFRARMGSLEVTGCTYRWSGRGEECEWCDARETVEHLVVECEGLREERGKLKEEIIRYIHKLNKNFKEHFKRAILAHTRRCPITAQRSHVKNRNTNNKMKSQSIKIILEVYIAYTSTCLLYKINAI